MKNLAFSISFLTFVTASFLLPTIIVGQDASNESIFYFSETGKNYIDHTSLQYTGNTSIDIIVPKNETVEEAFQYFSPNNVVYKRYPNEPLYDAVIINSGGYKSISHEESQGIELEHTRVENRDGKRIEYKIYKFSTLDSPKDRNGYFGYRWLNNGYSGFRLLFQFPSNIEILDYYTNRKGEWTENDNILVFNGEPYVNNIVFSVRYQVITITDTKSRVSTTVPTERIHKLEGRRLAYKKIYEVTSNSISIDVWDREKEDGDIISLRLNDDWIVRNLVVRNTKKKLFINLVEGENYLILHAENQGEIPPNTATISLSGKKNEIIELKSDMDISQGIIIKYEAL